MDCAPIWIDSPPESEWVIVTVAAEQYPDTALILGGTWHFVSRPLPRLGFQDTP